MSEKQTDNVKKFVAANKKSKVISGSAFEGGGGCYTLNNGEHFFFHTRRSSLHTGWVS